MALYSWSPETFSSFRLSKAPWISDHLRRFEQERFLLPFAAIVPKTFSPDFFFSFFFFFFPT